MKISEALKKIKRAGCYFLSHGSNHDWWFSPITNKKFQVPRHPSQEVTPKTKESIERYSGVKI
jgi:predicted RNA binding protein YcfA (HicA-like mRNA interferase family)